MALTATVATAVAILSAAVALRMPLLVLLPLAIGVGLVAANPARRVPRAGRHLRDLLIITGVGGSLVVLMAPTPDQYPAVAGVALCLPILLVVLWPAPTVLRYSLLVAAGCLAAAGGAAGGRVVHAAVLAAAAATALVALNRLGTPAAVRRERVAAEAAALFAIAAMIGLLVAVLLPPPDGGGGGGGGGRGPGRGGGAPSDDPPYLLPTDELDAGGPGTGDGNELVFRVSAPESALWRTMTFDTYDGGVWTRSDDFLTEPEPQFGGSGRWAVPPGVGDGVGDAAPGTGRAVRQRVTIETGYVAAFPAALRPESVDATYAAALPDGTVQGFLTEGDTYRVNSRVPPTGLDALRPRDARTAGIPFDVRRIYLPFAGLPSRVGELGTEITSGATTQADKVQAVVEWMRANTVVQAGTRRLPPGEDPVDRYLFADRAGSSLQAATATVLLLRTLGIPARLAVGYLPGEHAFLTGEFVVRARHAHEWAEVWFPEVGWVGFDPAGRFLGPEPAGDSLLDRLTRLWWALVIIAALLVASVAYRLLARRRRLRARPWATQTYERLTRAGGRHGRPRRPSETPSEYCGALAGDVDDGRLVEVGALVTAAAWSRQEPPAKDRAWADTVVAATEASAPSRMQRWRRRRRHRATGHATPPDRP